MGDSKKRKNASLVILLLALFLFVAASVVLTLNLVFNHREQEIEAEAGVKTEIETEAPPDIGPVLPEAVSFQPTIDEWVKTVGGNKSILIYDLNRNEIAGEYNTAEKYSTASLYKLFVVYEGYKRVNNGEWDGNEKAGSTGYTINECLDLAIRESYSPCAETLWAMIGYDALDKIIETDWSIVNSDIPKLTSNVSDITEMMKRFYLHPDFDSPELLSSMWDSFLNQPETTYDWRQGLPSGFKKASVYNKVGWDYNTDSKYWNIYHDTAIVKFPLADGTTRDFVVTVMTNRVDYKNIKKFGEMLENAFFEF